MNILDQIQAHPDERQALESSYAQTGGGGSMEDFLRYHASLYDSAQESDPRHAGVFFYGDTLDRLKRALRGIGGGGR